MLLIYKTFYFKFTDTILLKTAPFLDIQAGLNELKNVSSIHIIAVENEVKELLWKIEKSYSESPIINAVNLEKEAQFSTEFDLLKNYQASFSLPKKYVYEPNVSLLKSGGF